MRLVLLAVWLLINASCTGGFSARQFFGDSSSAAKLDGVKLYAVHCASCHNPFESSTKLGRTAQQITDAIRVVPSMRDLPTLRTLSTQEIQAISEVLINPPNQGSIPKKSATHQQPLGNRLFLATKMKSLFSEGDPDLDATIDSFTADVGRVHGGACTRLMPNCNGDESINLSASGAPLSNVLRNGYRIKVCEAVLESNAAVRRLLSQVNLSENSERSPANITTVFSALTSSTPDARVLASLNELGAAATLSSALESWRVLLLVTCKSSLFENF